MDELKLAEEIGRAILLKQFSKDLFIETWMTCITGAATQQIPRLTSCPFQYYHQRDRGQEDS